VQHPKAALASSYQRFLPDVPANHAPSGRRPSVYR
jgi:hypothetical protein